MSPRTETKYTCVLAMVLALGACTDPASNPGSGQLRIINGSHDAPALAIALDRSAIASTLAFGASSGYATVPPKIQTLTFTDTTGDKKLLLSSAINAPAAAITVFLLGEAASLATIVARDQSGTPTSSPSLRFVNGSPDLAAVDLRVNTFDGAASFGAAAFRSASAYQIVEASAYSFALVRSPAKGEQPGRADLLATFEPLTFETGAAYTLVALGTADPDDDYPLSLHLFSDNGDGKSVTVAAQKAGPNPQPDGSADDASRGDAGAADEAGAKHDAGTTVEAGAKADTGTESDRGLKKD